MKDELEAGFRRQEELKLIIAAVNDLGVKIQHAMGAILKEAGLEVGSKQTMGPRVQSFKHAKALDGFSEIVRDELVETSQPLVGYRNRLIHDEWTTLWPSDGVAAGDVLGQGEQYLTSTNLETLRIIRDAFVVVADVAELSFNEIAYRSIGKSPKNPLTDAKVTEALQEVRAGTKPDALPKWSVLKAMSAKEEAELVRRELEQFEN